MPCAISIALQILLHPPNASTSSNDVEHVQSAAQKRARFDLAGDRPQTRPRALCGLCIRCPCKPHHTLQTPTLTDATEATTGNPKRDQFPCIKCRVCEDTFKVLVDDEYGEVLRSTSAS
ncbi:hypothetical protein B0J14DRAFT_565274 [Halenospora varia]|nr:hypothetical protein B0J14DRAFT_565274 [Halenospora varia]